MSCPFSSAPPIELGNGLTLTAFDAQQAHALAQACAAIDPWARYGIDAADLFATLTRRSDALIAHAIACEGELAGGLVIHYPWLKGPYLQFLAVLPGWQKRGIGRAVLEWMEREARPASRSLWVLASDFNTPALALYESFGFRRVAPLPDLACDGCTEILLRKRLLR